MFIQQSLDSIPVIWVDGRQVLHLGEVKTKNDLAGGQVLSVADIGVLNDSDRPLLDEKLSSLQMSCHVLAEALALVLI